MNLILLNFLILVQPLIVLLVQLSQKESAQLLFFSLLFYTFLMDQTQQSIICKGFYFTLATPICQTFDQKIKYISAKNQCFELIFLCGKQTFQITIYNKNNIMHYQTICSDFTNHIRNRVYEHQNEQTHSKNQYLQRRKSNMINHLLDTIEYQSNDKNQIKSSLLLADKQFQTLYASTTNTTPKSKNTIRQQIQLELYTQSQNKKHKLSLPKPNTLTDQFIKLTLGCQGELIESYNETISPTKYSKTSQQERNKTAKEYFLSQKTSYQRLQEQRQGKNRKHANFFLNNGNDHPFYDQDYHIYLKTSALLLQNEKRKNKKIQVEIASITTDDKIKSQKIIQKLKQTGGIQDTIKIMEKSLNKNQIIHLKKNQYIKANKNYPNEIKHNLMNPQIKLQIQTKARPNHHKYRSTLTSKQSSLQKQQKKRKNRSQSIAFIQSNQNFFEKQSKLCQKKKIIGNWKQRSISLRQKISKNLANK